MFRTIIAATLLLSATAAQAIEHDELCLQYQSLATLTKQQADDGYPLNLHLAAIQEAKRFDLIWIIKEVHRKDMRELTPKQTGMIIWQACNSKNYPGAAK